MSEILKEAKLMQYILEFCGMGLLPIVLILTLMLQEHFVTREASVE